MTLQTADTLVGAKRPPQVAVELTELGCCAHQTFNTMACLSVTPV
jgi:hypothetical protein